MPLITLPLLIVIALLALIPVSIIQRFRRGIRRRQARGWVAALNLIAATVSVMIFLLGAYVASRWIPEALLYSVAGLTVGSLFGLLGAALTRWEQVDGRLYFTPNRWLVSALTLVVGGRVLYGFWRGWQAWRVSIDTMTWAAASGLAVSMSAGAVVLGYYLMFWTGMCVDGRRRHDTR
jgi:hypothetical protein